MVGGIISPRLARKINAAYRCAGCWSDLIVTYHMDGEFAGQYTLECLYCGTDVPGFVTRTYIDYRIRENEEEYRQVKIALQDKYPGLFPPTPKLTYDPALNEKMLEIVIRNKPVVIPGGYTVSAGPPKTESMYRDWRGSSVVTLNPEGE